MLLLCLMLLSGPAQGDVIQEALAHEGRTDADRTRDRTSKPADVVAFAGVKPGMTVLDFFAGGGYYSEILSHTVGPKGKIWLYNNNAYIGFVKDELAERLKDGRLKNIKQHTREADNMDLPDNHFDVVFMILAYHDFFYDDTNWSVDEDKVFRDVLKALKPGGVLLMVDHAAVEGSEDKAAQRLHRIDEVFTKKDVSARGFTFLKQADFLRNSKDDRKISVFAPQIRRRTDRFVYLFQKPK